MSISHTLAKALETSISAGTQEFQWEIFFKNWFREQGTPLYFLFKRHLGVTNTQYVELLSLVQLHTHNKELATANGRALHFHTTEYVRRTVVDAMSALLEASKSSVAERCLKFAETYSDLMAATVAVDMFYCSCAVFMPPGLETDVYKICADAGYVHSAGRSVYVRNIPKSRQHDLFDSIKTYLASIPKEDIPIPFVAYAHEDFSVYDKNAKDQIARGIDHTKLYLEKMSIGVHRLAQTIQEMRREFDGLLEIPEPGPYDQVHSFSKSRTLWLITDRSVGVSNPQTPGSERYYVCYEQLAKNSNPFFFFDENKPAWKSHTTLPHSLTAALLNATRPLGRDATICDPFGGTGTTWFEVRRIVPDAGILCSDLSWISPLMVSDNLRFFLKTADQLSSLAQAFEEIRTAVEADNRSPLGDVQATFSFDIDPAGSRPISAYLHAVALLKDLKHHQPDEDQEFEFAQPFVERLRALDELTRLLFYVVLRAELRFQGGYKRKSVTFNKAVCDSLDELERQVLQFFQVRRGMDHASAYAAGSYITFPGKYSRTIAPALHKKLYSDFESGLGTQVRQGDARSLAPRSVDVIICDPPYGFNTSEDQVKLAVLYKQFIASAVAALRDDGHILICLPFESYTGRELPFCTRSGLVTNQLLSAAHAVGRRVYVPAQSLPSPFLRPPFYWESERALRRTILYFRISDK